MSDSPKSPWRLDTNDRYREAVALILSLSTAALLLPVFLARDFLGVKPETALKEIFSAAVYWSWAFLGLSIFSGVVFHFLSAKWARIAWSQPVGIFGVPVTEAFIEKGLEVSFWSTVLGFFGGLGLTVFFFVSYAART